MKMGIGKAGFSLIECTAYLAGLLTLTYLVATFTQSIARSMLGDLARQRDATQLAYAMQLLSRDIRSAHPEPKFWHVGENRLVMLKDEEHVGWEIIDGKWYRIRGEFSSNTWSRTIHKMQLAAIENFECKLIEKNGLVRAVTIIKPIERTVPVKNGPI